MESDSSRTAPPPSAPDHQLPAGGNALSRLGDHAKGLSSDVRAWLELRFELAKIELFERLDDQADQVVLYAIVGAIGAVGGLVFLLAACFGVSLLVGWVFGWLGGGTLGALALGFLLVALFFFAVAGMLYATKPRFGLFESRTRTTVPEERVMDRRNAGADARSTA